MFLGHLHPKKKKLFFPYLLSIILWQHICCSGALPGWGPFPLLVRKCAVKIWWRKFHMHWNHRYIVYLEKHLRILTNNVLLKRWEWHLWFRCPFQDVRVPGLHLESFLTQPLKWKLWGLGILGDGPCISQKPVLETSLHPFPYWAPHSCSHLQPHLLQWIFQSVGKGYV